jgi:hypothetical protein
MFVSCEWCVLSGRGLCVVLITRPEESHRVWVRSWSYKNGKSLPEECHKKKVNNEVGGLRSTHGTVMHAKLLCRNLAGRGQFWDVRTRDRILLKQILKARGVKEGSGRVWISTEASGWLLFTC